MRILTLHAPLFHPAWRREHEVIGWGLDAWCAVQPATPTADLRAVLAALPWEPELIVWGDDHRLLRVLGLEEAPCPTVMVSRGAAPWHAPLAAAFDVACAAQSGDVAAFRDAGAADVRWLPPWAPDDLPPPEDGKSHAVAFVGSLDPRLHPSRGPFLDALRARLPLVVREGPWVEVYRRALIVVAQSERGELGSRPFEAMACGALVLAEQADNGLADLFTHGEDLVLYPRGSVEAAGELASRLLAAEPVRRRIAERGREKVRAAHLESHRARAVLLAGGSASRLPADRRRAGLARAYCGLAQHAKRLAVALAKQRVYAALAEAYLDAAARCVEPLGAEGERRAVLGAIALERGSLADAAEHLGWAAAHGGRLEDHLLRIEALARAGDAVRARGAAEALCAAFPAYAMGRVIVEGLTGTP
jgi:hypothetical protein